MSNEAGVQTAAPGSNVIKDVPAWMLSTQAFFAGWIAGGAGIVVGHPFDTIKTLQQTQTTSKTSVRGYQILKEVWTNHGVRGLYRGLTYPLVTYGAVNAAFFCGAEYARNFMFLKGLGDDMGKLTYTQIFLVGCAGGVAQIPVVVPSELIKIKLQNQLISGQRLYSGPIDCTVKLYKRYGIAHGYFRGTWSTIYRDIYAWGIYLLVFEAVRDKLSHHGCHYIVSELIAGGFAGVFGWVTATPFDVVKSRIQASEGKVKLVPVIKELYREEGLKAFTRGMAVSGLRGFPSNAVTLFGFAELMRWFNKANKDYYG